MFVCICHAIREKDVHRVVGGGETSLQGVYRQLGCKPRCGKCLSTMASTVAESAGETREPASS